MHQEQLHRATLQSTLETERSLRMNAEAQRALNHFLASIASMQKEKQTTYLPAIRPETRTTTQAIPHTLRHPHAYFSYAWPDQHNPQLRIIQHFVDQLAQDLRHAGVNTWDDRSQLMGNIDVQMKRGIDASNIVFFMGTRLYAQKTLSSHIIRTNVRKELDLSLQKHRESADCTLVPFLLEGGMNLADGMREIFPEFNLDFLILNAHPWFDLQTNGIYNFRGYIQTLAGDRPLGALATSLGFNRNDYCQYRNAFQSSYHDAYELLKYRIDGIYDNSARASIPTDLPLLENMHIGSSSGSSRRSHVDTSATIAQLQGELTQTRQTQAIELENLRAQMDAIARERDEAAITHQQILTPLQNTLDRANRETRNAQTALATAHGEHAEETDLLNHQITDLTQRLTNTENGLGQAQAETDALRALNERLIREHNDATARDAALLDAARRQAEHLQAQLAEAQRTVHVITAERDNIRGERDAANLAREAALLAQHATIAERDSERNAASQLGNPIAGLDIEGIWGRFPHLYGLGRHDKGISHFETIRRFPHMRGGVL